jgi:hypothetical protein
MRRTAYDAIVAAPPRSRPLEAALAGLVAAGELLEDRREHAVRRSRIVATNPSLQERELLKLASMADATTEALHERAVDGPTATLAAQSAVTIFQVAFERWVSADDQRPFADCISEAAAALRALR